MLWESIEKPINFGLGERDVVAGLAGGLTEEMVARVLGLRRAESSRSRSREALHSSIKFISGDGGSIGSDSDDGVPVGDVGSSGRGGTQSSGKGVARADLFFGGGEVSAANGVMSVGVSTEGRFDGSIGRFRCGHRAKLSSCRRDRGSRGCGRSSSALVRAGRGCCEVYGTRRTCVAHRDGSQRGFRGRFVA
jgi:hypothetical protein